ncbi:MAG: Ig-like domain repeat protein [Verrucomicrobiota bacterium]
MRTPTIIHRALAATQRLALASGTAAIVALAINSAQATTTTSIFNLGAAGSGTTLGQADWIAAGALPTGSILKAVSINARLDDSGPNGAYASDLHVTFDGGMTIGADGGSPDWANGYGGDVGTTVIDTKYAGIDFASNIDLSTTKIYLDGWYGPGVWSGTITLRYEIPGTPPDPVLTYDFSDGLQGWTQIYAGGNNGNVWNSGGKYLGNWNDDSANTYLARSPEFQLLGSGNLTFQLAGGQSPLAAPAVAPSAIPQSAVQNNGFAGAALRNVATDTYVLSARRNGSSDQWQTGTFTAAQLAPFVGDGNMYTLDYIDYNKGGWGWTVLDNVSIPGAILPPAHQKNILTFTFPTYGAATISGTDITLTVPNGTGVTALAPTYTFSGVSCAPDGGSTQNFTNTVDYTVTADDASTKVYHVTVTVAPAPPGGVGDGLVVWLKADDINTGDANQVRTSGSDTFVKLWNDASGSGRKASNATEGDQPKYIASALNGKPAIRFTEDLSSGGNAGTRLYLGDLSAQTPTAGSVFVVASPDETTTRTGYTLFDNRDNDGRWLSGPSQYNESTPGTFRGGRDGSFSTDAIKAAWPTSGSHVFAMESSSSIYRYLIDGAALATGSADYNSGSGQNWTIGNRAQGGNGGSQLNGDISELVIFNRVLSTDEANQVGKYLADKYGVQTTYVLPGTATTTTLASSSSTSNYGDSVTLTATVAPAPTGGTVQFRDNGFALGSPVEVDTVTGQAQLATSALSTGGHSITVTYSGTTGISGSTSSSITQTVDKATATITTAPMATAISYGQTLASSTLSGGAGSVAGSFAFTTPTTAPGVGTSAQNITFTPTDANYTTATTSVSVTVNMATPVYKAPASGAGQMVTVNFHEGGDAPTSGSGPAGESSNWNDYNDPGNWNVEGRGGLIDSAGAATSVGFSFAIANQGFWSGGVTLPMIQGGLYQPWSYTDAPSDWKWCEITGLTSGKTYTLYIASFNKPYGNSARFEMNNTAGNGQIQWVENDGSTGNSATWVEGENYAVFKDVLPDGNNKIVFQIGGNNGKNAFLSGFQLVAAGAPTLEATDIVYGQQLSASVLGGTFVDAAGVVVAGTLAFTHPNEVPNVGTASHSVTFTPTDTANYNSATTSVNVTVTAPTDPFASWISTNYPGLSDNSATGDPDGDGMSNKGEYAFGLDPSNGTSCNPIKTPLDKTSGTFTYTRRVGTGYTYRVWTSTELVTGWTEDTGATEVNVSTVGDVQSVTVKLSASTPLAASKLFMRVSAE